MENGVRKPVSRTTGLPVNNNLRKAQFYTQQEAEKLPEAAQRRLTALWACEPDALTFRQAAALASDCGASPCRQAAPH